MAAGDETERGFWSRVDAAAFGMIYGGITVLSTLMAIKVHPEAPLELAVILFGSVLAIVLAKGFAEAVAHAIESGERLTRVGFRKAWAHSRPSLIAANVPAGLMLIAAVGAMGVDLAIGFSELYCVALLLLVGGRVGWVLDKSWLSVVLGAGFAGGIGLLLAAGKYLLH